MAAENETENVPWRDLLKELGAWLLILLIVGGLIIVCYIILLVLQNFGLVPYG